MGLGIKETLHEIRNDSRSKDKNEDISFNRFFNDYSYKASNMGLLSNCFLCGEDITGRKNSHSIPQSILKNIESDGRYCQITCALGDGMIFGPIGRTNRSGLNNTGVFHMLCESCENKTFKEYENSNFFVGLSNGKKEVLTDKVLAEMMLKSALRERYKKEFSKNMAILMNEKADENKMPFKTDLIADQLNIIEYTLYINKCKEILKNNKKDVFNVFYLDILDHPSSFACQTLLAIQKTVTNDTINDVYNYDPNYNVVLSVFCIFPLKSKTVCIAYCLKEESDRLLPYIKYMNGLNDSSKRKLFQSTLFMYSEEVYTNEKMILEIRKDNISMEYIMAAAENCITIMTPLSKRTIIDKPLLIAPNKYRKSKLLI